MARKKISEFRAKTILTSALGLPYEGLSFDASSNDSSILDHLDSSRSYVVKVDEGVKKRMKQGLLALNKKPSELPEAIKKLQERGYTHLIIEPFLSHDVSSEKYFSIEQFREGLHILYSPQGGIDIEENQDKIERIILPLPDISISERSQSKGIVFDSVQIKRIAEKFSLQEKILQKIFEAFNTHYFSFLEINPFVIQEDKYSFLDVAAEVDSTAEFFVKGVWSEKDFRSGITKQRIDEELAIGALAAKSQAAFSLEVLNPNGSIFMMLSGGGASIVLADEVYNQGKGAELANYGEYSGNPNAEETYIYAKNILSLLLKSEAREKVLIIAGGVANFTDVRITFKGLIKALDEVKEKLKKQGVTIFVRRGGPYQEEGLAMMKAFLEKDGLLGVVSGPEMVLTQVVTEALKVIK